MATYWIEKLWLKEWKWWQAKNVYLEIFKDFLNSRLKEETEILKSISKIRNNEGWKYKDKESAGQETEYICALFEEPLENVGTKNSLSDILGQCHSLHKFANEFSTLQPLLAYHMS